MVAGGTFAMRHGWRRNGAVGHKRTRRLQGVASAIAPIAAADRRLVGVRFGPSSASRTAANIAASARAELVKRLEKKDRLTVVSPKTIKRFDQAAASAATFFRFLRQPNRPSASRPEAKRGKAVGIGVALTLVVT